jgi:hypothetical protein
LGLAAGATPDAALRLGLIAGLVFSVLLFGSSFLVPFIYPNVGKEVLHFTFWGLIIAACVQPAKVLNRASPENALFPRRHTLQDKAFLAFRK